MSTYATMLERFLQADRKTLVAAARTAVAKLTAYAGDVRFESAELLGNIVICAIGADGKLSASEKQFLADVLGLENEQLSALLANYNKDTETYVDHIADTAGKEVKGAILTLIAATAAVDGNLSAKENSLIRKILA